MSETLKHTPGPWTQRGKYIYATGSVDTFDGPVIGVIAVCEDTEQTDSEGRTWSVAGDALGNACLIAAAPEMAARIAAAQEEIERLKRERDELIHDIARVKDSETLHLNRAEAAEADNARLKRLATDRSYMLDAYRNMLGEKGLQVAAMWAVKGVTRLHIDWGPDAAKLTGEERAQVILDTATALEKDCARTALQGGKDAE